jgi:hypothetical protein
VLKYCVLLTLVVLALLGLVGRRLISPAAPAALT